MLIRWLSSSDQAFLWDALYYAIHVPAGEAVPSREIVNRLELSCYVSGWMQRPGDLGVVAEDHNVPIGAAWLRCWTCQHHGYGFVGEKTPELSMSVVPGYRGRGVGTKMLRRLLSAAEDSFTAVSLSVSESNPAKRLYEREGFVPIGPSGDGPITMVKVLSGQSAI